MVYGTLCLFICMFFSQSVQAISPIQIKGSKFFTSTGEQFFMKGIAYQLSPADPLLDATVCESNFALMAAAGTNVIRTYHVDPWQDHSPCMSILAKYGMYLILDVDTFNTTISQETPAWDYYQMRSYQHVVAAFAQYDNLLGFFCGNEIVNTAAGTIASPYIKASVRDVKSFIAEQGYRAIPVGYSAADIAEIRPAFQNYLVCNDGATNNDQSAIDFFGLNIYEWCGQSTYEISGYADRTAEVQNYPVPVFFSEFGCNTVQPRAFQDIDALYGPEMSQVWSGGIVYEWLQEDNDYGLVDISQNGVPSPRADYSVLSSRWAQVSPLSTAMAAYNPTNTVPTCPTNTGGFTISMTALPGVPTSDGTSDWEPAQDAALPVSANSPTRSTGTAMLAGAVSTTTSMSRGAVATTSSSTRSSSQRNTNTASTAVQSEATTTSVAATSVSISQTSQKSTMLASLGLFIFFMLNW